MTLNRSDCFSCAVCGSLCLFKRAPAGVAVPSTSLATTAQRAQMQGFWVVLENVAAESARKREGVSERIWRCVTWTWVPMSSLTSDAWKSSSTDCHCGVVGSGHHHGLPLSRDGVAQRGTVTTDGKSLARARGRKERTHPELTGEHGRARLVVLGVRGRWSAETSVFLRSGSS